MTEKSGVRVRNAAAFGCLTLFAVLGATAGAAGATNAPATTAATSATPTAGRAFVGDAPQAGPRGEAADGSESVVVDTTTYPARAVGTLTFVQGGEAGACTGFMIDANTVLTAAHCVHQGGGDVDSAWSTDLVFNPGQNGETTPYRTCNGTGAHAPDGWLVDGLEASDYGVVQLDCNIGRRVGWFGLTLSGQGNGLVGRLAQVRSYPTDLAGQQDAARGRIRATNPKMLFHDAPTAPGSDGAPVFAWSAGCGGPCAMGVQASDAHGSTATDHGRFAHGPRFNERRFSLLLDWADENN